MKKYLKYILALLFTIFLLVLIYYRFINNENKEINVSKEKSNFSKQYNIDKDNVFRKISAKGAINLIKNKTGIIYIGYKDCPWCKAIVPLLNEVSKDNNINIVYYIDNFYNMRPDKTSNPINIDEYNELVSLLGNDIVTVKKDENSFDIIRVPLILFIKDGKIVDYHKGTYEGHVLKEKIDENGNIVNYLEELTKSQKQEIKDKLEEKIRKVYSNKCNGGC